MISYVPKFVSSRAMLVYIALLFIVPIVFGYPMLWYWWIFGIVEVCAFFYFSNLLSKQWSGLTNRTFEQTVFKASLVIRLMYVLISYLFYQGMTGKPFEFGAADALWYDSMGRLGSDIIWGADIKWSVFFEGVDLGDIGYPIYLTAIYALTGKSIFLARCVKALMSAWTVVLMYRIATRNFGESTGRITALFCMLMPNLIYYCGAHLKETEMLFLTVLFIERADAFIRNPRFKLLDLIVLFAICGATFFFREVLCAVLFLAFGFALILGSTKIKSLAKRALTILMGICFAGVLLLNGLFAPFEDTEYTNLQDMQSANMEWRSTRAGGNQFASMASSAVFAPLIFTIPFPTMVNIPYQQNQQMIHGGNFVKNITSFFCILAMFVLLFSGKWRDKVLPISFTCGYLLVLIFSVYAQSERFHIPSLPFELMFAAWGVTLLNGKYKKWFGFWSIFIFVANIGWAWFKLRGRGM